MEIISYTTPKAKKEHICDYCNDKIPIGQKYRRSFCKEDEIYIWKNHLHCEEIMQKLGMFDEDSVTQDLFVESVKEEYDRIMEIHESEIFNYEHFKYPSFSERLKYVCDFHKININF